jgi:hypothetical protein
MTKNANKGPGPSLNDAMRGIRPLKVEGLTPEEVQEVSDALLLWIRAGHTPVRAVVKVAADQLFSVEAVERVAMDLVKSAKDTLLDPDLHDMIASDVLRTSMAFARLCAQEVEKEIPDDDLPVVAEKKHNARLRYMSEGRAAIKGVMDILALRDPRFVPGTKNTLEVKIKGGTEEEQALVALLMGEDPKNLPRIAGPLDAEDAMFEVVDARS